MLPLVVVLVLDPLGPCSQMGRMGHMGLMCSSHKSCWSHRSYPSATLLAFRRPLDAHTPSTLSSTRAIASGLRPGLNCLIFGKDAAYRHLQCPD